MPNQPQPTVVQKFDAQGRAVTNPGVLQAGEDLAAGVMKTEQAGGYGVYTGPGTLNIKPGAGHIYNVTVDGGTMGTAAMYDSLTATGPKILDTITPVQGQVLARDKRFNTGLTIVLGGATVISYSIR